VFPRFRRTAVAVGAGLVASALVGWGLYVLITGSAAT